MIHNFFNKLKESFEEHSADLKRGESFNPEYLKKKKFTKDIIPKVVKTLSKKLNLKYRNEVPNPMPEGFDFQGKRQRVDFVFYNGDKPKFFFEVESLDRAQLYTFKKSGQYKLEYYDATICNDFWQKNDAPRYFVWLLILPDKEVSPYQIWDAHPYKFIHSDLKKGIFKNPYRFYDSRIKALARRYLKKKLAFKNPEDKWEEKRLKDFQRDCELVFITCTIKELILSRGKYLFNPDKEKRIRLNW